MKAIVVLLPLALAACGSKPSVSAENASVEEVAAKVKAAGGQAVFLSPGHWDSTVTIQQVSIPGMPPEVTAHMKQAMAGKVTGSCLTPEQAKRPGADFFGGKDRKDCRYEHFEMGDGKLDARMVCSGAGAGGAATITMQGTYGPDAFKMAMTTEAKGGAGAPMGPMGPMTMAATIDSKRTGACTGEE